MNLRDLAFTLPCRRKSCSARPGEKCKGRDRVTIKGVRYYVHHQVRTNDARYIAEKQNRIKELNARYAPQSSSKGETGRP